MSSPTHALAAPQAPAKSAAPFAVNPARLLRLQRACACGGQCDSCQKKQEPQPILQRKAVPAAPPAAAAPAAAKAAPQPAAAAQPAAKTAAPKASASAKAADAKAPGDAAHAKDKAAAAAPEKDHPKSATPAITEKKKSGDANADLPPIVRRVIDTPGEPLEFSTRAAMESR